MKKIISFLLLMSSGTALAASPVNVSFHVIKYLSLSSKSGGNPLAL